MDNFELKPLPKLAPGEYEWVEKAGIENLKQRVGTADTLAKEAVTTLTVLLAGAGGAWAYAAKLLDDNATNGGVAAVAAGVWLTLLAALLVFKCMQISPIPAVYNQPGQLLQRDQHGESLEDWQLGELVNVENRIRLATSRNQAMARNLNLVRQLATATPLVAAFGVLLFGA